MEFSVGLMLILLGVLNLTGAMKWLTLKFSPAHPKVHRRTCAPSRAQLAVASSLAFSRGGRGASRRSLNPPARMRAPFAQLGIFHTLRPLFVGIVHGLAGSAAVALLVLSTIREPKVGGALPAGFWRGNYCRHDVDHRGYRAALFVRGIQIRVAQQGPDYRFRAGEFRVRTIYLLPHRAGGGAFHQPSDLDAELTARLRTSAPHPLSQR